MMTTYEATFIAHGRVPDVDGHETVIAVHSDGEDLGAFAATMSGPLRATFFRVPAERPAYETACAVALATQVLDDLEHGRDPAPRRGFDPRLVSRCMTEHPDAVGFADGDVVMRANY